MTARRCRRCRGWLTSSESGAFACWRVACPLYSRGQAPPVRSQAEVVGDMEADRQAARDGLNPNR